MKHFISTLNPITLQIFLYKYPYLSKRDYLNFPAILKFSINYLNTIKLINLGVTTNHHTNYQIMKNENKSKSLKNRKRNTWFNPLFSKNVFNNIGKYFRLSIQKHFSNNHKYHKNIQQK